MLSNMCKVVEDESHFILYCKNLQYNRVFEIPVNKILNRNEFGEGNDTNQGRRVFLFY
jgi:hypothetical protein